MSVIARPGEDPIDWRHGPDNANNDVLFPSIMARHAKSLLDIGQPFTANPIRLIGVPICPDLLDHSALGAADNLRGRVVRGFFWLLRLWPTAR